MTFTTRCGKCHHSIHEHIRVKTKTGVKTWCPPDHYRAWKKKWGWKFKTKYGQFDEREARRAYDRVIFRMPKVGLPGPRRPEPRGKKRACGYCGNKGGSYGLVTDKKYKHLCLKCDERLRKARERAKTGKFSDRDPTMRFYVTIKYLDKQRGTVHHTIKVVIANDAQQAKEIAKRELPKKCVWLSGTATRMKQKTEHHIKERYPAKTYTAGQYRRKTERDRSHEQPTHSPAQVIRAYESVEAMLKLAKTSLQRGNKVQASRLMNSAERVMLMNFEDAAHAVNCGNCIPNAAKARELHQTMRRVYKMFDALVAMRDHIRTKKPRRARRKG